MFLVLIFVADFVNDLFLLLILLMIFFERTNIHSCCFLFEFPR